MLTRQPPPANFVWTADSIRALRNHLAQSQSAFARELGIRQQTVSEWETGMYKPRGASVTILTLLAVSSGFPFDTVDAGLQAQKSAADMRPQPPSYQVAPRRSPDEPPAPRNAPAELERSPMDNGHLPVPQRPITRSYSPSVYDSRLRPEGARAGRLPEVPM